MTRQASTKPADSTAALGSKLRMHSLGLRHSGFDIVERVQHFIHHLAPQGMAGFVLANGSMSSTQSGEGDRTI